jgi:D-alanyl-D-alanine carboxypeptidase (penicillin-binding protein 5/6)
MRFGLLGLLTLFISAPAFAQSVPLETVAKQAYIIDAETGQVLFDKNGDEKMPTSSMSKTMTMYVVFDALKSGKLTLDQELPVSENAWRMQGSKMFVPLGQMVKVEDLIRGVIIQSGNDATIVLAEGLAGSEGEFAVALNKKAKELGMLNSNFANASGWPDPNHYSTCHDLATLGLALIHDFPEQYKYYSEIEFTYNNIKQGNRNPLLYKNIGADGIKTGHAEEAGYGLMGSAVRGGRRVVMVLNGMASMDERAQESTRLMEWALSNFTNTSILTKGMQVATAPVVMGVERTVPLIVEKDLKVTMPRMAGTSGIKVQAVFKGPIEAPVKKGQEIGVVRVEMPNMKPIEIPAYAAKDIPRLGFFPSMLEKLERLVFGERVPSAYASTEGTAP